MEPITVLIADDDYLIREAMVDLIGSEPGLEIVGVAADALEATEMAARVQPAVAVLDVRMGGGGGIAAASALREKAPGTKVVVLSALEDRAIVAEMLGLGVAAYVVKGVPGPEIVDAVRRAARGQFSMPVELAIACHLELIEERDARHLAEAVRGDLEETLKGLMHLPDTPLALLDREGTVQLCNARLEALFGYQGTGLAGLSAERLVADASRKALRAHLGSGPDGRVHDVPLVGRRQDGSEFGMSIRLSPIGAGSGARWLVSIRDGAHGELGVRPVQGHGELFRRLLDAAPDAMVAVSEDGRIELVNRQTELLFGYEREEILGQPVEILLPKSMGRRHARHRARYWAEPRVRTMGFGLPLTGRRKDGAEFPVDVSLSPVEAPTGRLVVSAIRDITERKLAEGVLRREPERIRQLVESSPDGVLIVDSDGRIQLVNAQAELLFGYRREELTGQQVEVLLPDAARAAHAAHRAAYLSAPQRRPMGAGLELAGKRQDGTEFPVDVSLSPRRTSEGLFAVAHVRDITERKRAERELLRSQLVRAQEDERLRIASDIHDDTIQAITAAGLRLQLVKRHLHDEKQLQALTKLEETIQLAIGRLRSLMFDLRPPALDRDGLKAALRTYLDQLQADTGATIRLESKLRNEPAQEARATLYRIAQEALTNVRKHARATSVSVALEEEKGGVLATVEDDGVGFDVASLEAQPGHLGLPAIKERAELGRGWCRIESRPGGGTTVRFWVPNEAVEPSDRG